MVVLHLDFLQIIVSNNKDDTEVPVRYVSWFFQLVRTDIGYETWKGLRRPLFSYQLVELQVPIGA